MDQLLLALCGGIYTTDTIKYKYPILAESSSNVGIIVLDVSNYKSYATIY